MRTSVKAGKRAQNFGFARLVLSLTFAMALTAGPATDVCRATVAGRVASPGVGRVGSGVGFLPGAGAGAAGVGIAPGVGVGAPGVGVLPHGYYAAVPVGYTTVAYGGYSCRYVGGVYYRPMMYQGATVWVIL